jgi:hypothetical protein
MLKNEHQAEGGRGLIHNAHFGFKFVDINLEKKDEIHLQFHFVLLTFFGAHFKVKPTLTT